MAQRAGVSFELERLDLQGDELIVTGHWSGVRGLRFVRPTLVADDRRILATLEHKPWAPSLDRAWIAAFPWDRAEVDAGALTLAVGPQVTVPLDGTVAAEPEPEPEPEPETNAAAPEEPEPEPAAASQPQPRRQPAPERAEPTRAPAATATQQAEIDRVALLEDELARVARERDALRHRVEDLQATGGRDRERARAQLEEAVAAREAAIRTRARMERTHDESLRAREQAEAALVSAHAQRDEANAQRDEVLLAYRALQRRMRAERAHADRGTGVPTGAGEPIGRDEPAGTGVPTDHCEPAGTDDGLPAGAGQGLPTGPGQGVPAGAGQGVPTGAGEPAAGVSAAGDPDEPIGVRTMPAARTVMAELQRPTKPPNKLPFSMFDLWVIRVLGTVAAGCFILLLVSILRVFI